MRSKTNSNKKNRLSRRGFLANLGKGAAVAAISGTGIAQGLAKASKPNIIVILADDLGYGDLSSYGAKDLKSPHIDRLVERGMRLDNFYANCPVCSPTRAGIMIGGYQQRVGVYTAGDGGRGFDPRKKIFPSFLPDQYVSTAIGKWHLGLDDDFPELKWHAVNRGFDECYKFMGRGGHSYFDLRSDSDGKFAGAIYRKRIGPEPEAAQVTPWEQLAAPTGDGGGLSVLVADTEHVYGQALNARLLFRVSLEGGEREILLAGEQGYDLALGLARVEIPVPRVIENVEPDPENGEKAGEEGGSENGAEEASISLSEFEDAFLPAARCRRFEFDHL